MVKYYDVTISDLHKYAISKDPHNNPTVEGKTKWLGYYFNTDPDGKKLNPIERFALVASFFAGVQTRKMEEKLEEYKTLTDNYKEVLHWSQRVQQWKVETKDGKDDVWMHYNDGTKFNQVIFPEGKNYINDFRRTHYDNTYHLFGKDEVQAVVDVVNQRKDMVSTELQKLSTEVDMAVKDAGEAEQMAANAVKKLTDLLSTQAKNAGG